MSDGMWAVVNISDPDQHDVGWTNTETSARDLAMKMTTEFPWRYGIEYHTCGLDCICCRRMRRVPLCWPPEEARTLRGALLRTEIALQRLGYRVAAAFGWRPR